MKWYNEQANKFVGLNPKHGEGSGFLLRALARDGIQAMTDLPFGQIPDTNAGRKALCTCDCKGSPDGVGCVGWGGISFRYASLLSSRGKTCTEPWKGQMAAKDCLQVNCAEVTTTGEYFGEDLRVPGGMAVYSVDTTLDVSDNAFQGVFRQANDAVSCTEGIKDEDSGDEGSCAKKCGSKGKYAVWLKWCRGKGPNDGFEGKSERVGKH